MYGRVAARRDVGPQKQSAAVVHLPLVDIVVISTLLSRHRFVSRLWKIEENFKGPFLSDLRRALIKYRAMIII